MREQRRRDRERGRDNETEMEGRWRKPERQWGGKECQEALKKLNLSSKWLLNKRLRQQNEIIHIHSQSHIRTEASRALPSSQTLELCACGQIRKFTRFLSHKHTLVYAAWCTCAHIALADEFDCHKHVECKHIHVYLCIALKRSWYALHTRARTHTHNPPNMHYSFTHGDRSFKGVFHTSSHFN